MEQQLELLLVLQLKKNIIDLLLSICLSRTNKL